MNKLTIKLNYFLDYGLIKYLKTFNGVKQVYINDKEDEISIEYEKKLTNIKLIKQQIELYLKINIPSLIGFDKHSKEILKTYKMNINDFCCEYCMAVMIEDLIEIEGIENAHFEISYETKKSIITINYDKKQITKDKIIELEKIYNS